MGIQDYLRMANIFGSPAEAATLGERAPAYEDAGPNEDAGPQLQTYANDDNEPSSMDLFKQHVLAGPNTESKKSKVLRGLGTGALSWLKGSENEAGDREAQDYENRTAAAQRRQPKLLRKHAFDPFNIKEAGDIINMPQEQYDADYKLKGAGLEKAANQEITSNKNFNANFIAGQREGRLGSQGDRKLDQGDTRLGQGDRNLDIRQQTADTADFKAKHPNAQQMKTKGGNIILYDPATKEVHDAGIPQGTNTDTETEAARMARVAAQQTGATQRTGMQQTGADIRNKASIAGAMDRTIQQGENAINTKEVIPEGKPESASQSKVRLQLRANELIQSKPEYADFVQTDPNTGMVNITPPPSEDWYGRTFGSGPSKKVYDEIVAHMKGGSQGPVTPKGKPAGSVVEPPKNTAPKTDAEKQGQKGSGIMTQRNKKTGQVRTSTDGGKTWKMQ